MPTAAEEITLAWEHVQASRPFDAEQCCRHVLDREPTYPDAWFILGVACQFQGKLDEAMASYEQALRLRPDFAQVHSNLGLIHANRAHWKEAIASYTRALELEPGFADACNNLGIAFIKQGMRAEAATAFQRAIDLDPNQAAAHNNLGNVLKELGMLEEAVASYKRALELRPDYADAYNNLGVTLTAQGQWDQAAYSYQQALTCRPDYASAHSNLLSCWNYDPTADNDALFAEHRNWAERHARVPLDTAYRNDRNPNRVLRVGYVSPDFFRHAVADFLKPIFAHHDPSQVELYCYAQVLAPDATTVYFQSRAHQWRWTLGLSDVELADQIRNDQIDILVDLAGHTANSRLLAFAYKPAPVQITYLGYPNTTGLTTVDYRLTDAIADPLGEPVRHTEELVRLPLAFCYQPPDHAPDVSPSPALALGRITFGSLNNLAKLNEQVIDLWCAILQAVPTSRLLIFRNSLRGSGEAYFHRQFILRGIGPERFTLSHAVPDERNYLSIYESIDVALDPFPWSGHTTTCEALWMGVPVITLYGERYATRMAACALTALGMTEFIADTPERYLETASGWADDVSRLARLRSGLRDRMRASPLCDGQGFTRSLEQTYRELWRRWCAKKLGEP
jgi:predicted O-linked N-acetylglucosamine transferase (SPINDLY family)